MVQVDGQWYLYYSANPGGSGQIGLAREVPGVRRVEVSTDDGHTWRLASVAADGTWSISWTPPADGAYKVRARVVDDFMLGDATAATAVNVGAGALQPPAQPILLVTDKDNTANPFNGYLAEIMRAEGLVEFQQVELSALMSSTDPAAYLARSTRVVLAQATSTPPRSNGSATTSTAGGTSSPCDPTRTRRPVRPDVRQRAPEQLLEYFGVDTTQGPGTGITATSLQYHGEADNYTLNGADLTREALRHIDTASNRPATSIANAGQGRAAAFTFDLAKSIVLTRQGNPAWKDQDGGDGPRRLPARGPLREFGRPGVPVADAHAHPASRRGAALLRQPRAQHARLSHAAHVVPARQAHVAHRQHGRQRDLGESQLAPVINDANSYGGTFTSFLRESAIEGTSVATEAAWNAAGNGQSVHGYGDRTLAGMTASYAAIVAEFEAKFVHAARTARNHTIAWTGWSDMAAIEAANGVELDTNYYHYMNWLLGYGDNAKRLVHRQRAAPEVQRRAGQRVADLPGAHGVARRMVRRQPLQRPGQLRHHEVDARRLGQRLLLRVRANIHHIRYNGVDAITHDWANMLWAYARDHGIPMWSAEKLADFVEAATPRSSQRRLERHQPHVRLLDDEGGQPLTIMVPAEQGSSQLLSVHVGGAPASFTEKTIKGRKYAMVATAAASAPSLRRTASTPPHP